MYTCTCPSKRCGNLHLLKYFFFFSPPLVLEADPLLRRLWLLHLVLITLDAAENAARLFNPWRSKPKMERAVVGGFFFVDSACLRARLLACMDVGGLWDRGSLWDVGEDEGERERVQVGKGDGRSISCCRTTGTSILPGAFAKKSLKPDTRLRVVVLSSAGMTNSVRRCQQSKMLSITMT